MSKYFDVNNKKLCEELKKKKGIDLNDKNTYNLDYGNCSLTCVHRAAKVKNIVIPRITKVGLCFTLPLILPDLDCSHPEANVLNSFTLARRYCKDFQNQCEELLHKNCI